MKLQAERRNVEIFECFASETRLHLIELLNERPMNIKELAEAVGLSSAIVTKHIRKMEDAGLLVSEAIAGKRGMQKLCRLAVDELAVRLTRETAAPQSAAVPAAANRYEVSIPVGQYASCAVKPTCGLASETSILGMVDDPRYFTDPEHVKASHLWFGSGYVEYRIPNYLLRGQAPLSLEISLEICSEAPGYNENWPSDISFYINDVLLGTWTCPGDFGSTRGVFTPEWWSNNSQYGLLKTLSVSAAGAYIDGVRLSDVDLGAIGLSGGQAISFRIAAHETARHCGGVTLFGRGFGNYDQDIRVSLTYA
ncbi:ArsR/SmtB family transcription factor [Paenibacillus sp.]|uniref:ArsR/SmtB family transcription factor n=1 Tax=Paenibacillus sp. TaxID=58172 RepID=UPI002D46ABA1|nr:ArsR family transcriptional regulator [Paenibacillus sp.]HZG58270.1 ArsR family transcriptional regulator [Paenibacillus sp.]